MSGLTASAEERFCPSIINLYKVITLNLLSHHSVLNTIRSVLICSRRYYSIYEWIDMVNLGKYNIDDRKTEVIVLSLYNIFSLAESWWLHLLFLNLHFRLLLLEHTLFSLQNTIALRSFFLFH
jgi:hypothetical protein